MNAVNLNDIVAVGSNKKVLAEFRKIVEGRGLDVKESLKMIGWQEVNSELQSLLTKTYNMVTAAKEVIETVDMPKYSVIFENKRSKEYGRTYERCTVYREGCVYTLIIGMPSSAYKVMLYKKVNNGDLTTELGRFKTIKEE